MVAVATPDFLYCWGMEILDDNLVGNGTGFRGDCRKDANLFEVFIPFAYFILRILKWCPRFLNLGVRGLYNPIPLSIGSI